MRCCAWIVPVLGCNAELQCCAAVLCFVAPGRQQSILPLPHQSVGGSSHTAAAAQSAASLQILEECGYDVPLASIHRVTSYISAIGISGSRQTIFAAEVDDGMAAAAGGGGLR